MSTQLELIDPSNSIVTPSNIIVDVVEQTFIEIVKKSLENNDIKNNISIKLTPEIISIINNIISLTPNTLNDIERASAEIIKDSKIDMKDIPNLIIVIQNLYQFIYSSKTVKYDSKKRVEITSTSLKYLIHLLVLERKIKVDDDKKEEFLKEIDALIDSCSNLLSFPKSLKIRGCIKNIW